MRPNKLLSRFGWTAAVLLVVGACGGDSVDLPVASRLAVVPATDAQSAFVGGRLPAPLAVTAGAADGTLVPRAVVRWTVTDGDGAGLSDTLTQADGNGEAAVWLTLGPQTGSYTVRAQLANAPTAVVAFTATAVAAPQLTALAPSSFTGGDTVTLRGADLADTLLVEIGGEPAPILAAGAAGDSLNVLAPPCLLPGAVPVALTYGGARLDSLDGTYQASSPPLVLVAGQYAALDPAILNGCATFPAAGPSGAEYLLAPQSAASLPGLLASYRLTGDPAVPVVARAPETAPELPFAMRFHDLLRERERDVARAPKPRRAPDALGPALTLGIEVGHRRDFRVCSALPCDADDFVTVRAVARYVGRRAAVYQDWSAPPGGLTDEDVQEFGELFDNDLYPVATGAFGAESDVDRNGHVLILMTPVVNGLTPPEQCGESVITGFFFAIDVDPAFEDDSRSNQAEVVYSLTADPTGERGCPLSADLVRRIVAITFIHELQHLISYNQHVLLRGGDTEDLWINEGLSHLSEDLSALHFFALGDDALGSQFALGNMFNSFQYLKQPGATFLQFVFEGVGTLPERGAAWLFLRWMTDQFGEGLPRRLVETRRTGAANLEAAAGEPLARLLVQWFLANYVSDLPGLTAPSRLTYATWDFRQTYESLHSQLPGDFDRPFPIVPQEFSGGTFNVTGELRSGSGDYYLVVQAGGAQGFTVELTNFSGGGLPASMVPRLGVIRIR
jgi:hypothetical protein